MLLLKVLLEHGTSHEHIAMTNEQPPGKSRAKSRQRRGKPKGVPTPEPNPVGLYGMPGDNGMQEEMDALLSAAPAPRPSTGRDSLLASRTRLQVKIGATPKAKVPSALDRAGIADQGEPTALDFDDMTPQQQRAHIAASLRSSTPTTSGHTQTDALRDAQQAMKDGPVETAGETPAEALARTQEYFSSLEPDATARETLTALQEAITAERTRIAEGAATPERMRDLKEQQELSKIAESSYFDELKKYHKNRGAAGIAAENFVGELGTPSHIKSLRRVWVLTRAQHYTAQQAALNARLATRPRSKEAVLESLEKYKGKGSIDESKLRERYERVVTMRTFVDGLEEREQEKRQEGLSERDKKALDKLYDRYKELPPAVRIFGTSAALLGVGATAGVLLGGSVIGLVPLGLAGTSAALRFWAEKSKNPEAKKWMGEMSRYTSMGGAFGALVKMGIEKGHAFAGTEEKASEFLSNRKGLGDLGDVKNLRRLSQKRKEALVVKESIARQSRLASALTSLGLGFLLGHHAPGGHAHGTDPGVPAATPEQMKILAEGKADLAYHGPDVTTAHLKSYLGHTHTPFPHESAPPETGAGAGVVPVHPAAPGDSVIEVSTKPGEGFGQLLVDLRHQVGTLEHASPELKHFLEQNPNALTHALGVAHDGQSLTLQPGDTLFVDSNQHVWYHAVGKDPQLVFEHVTPTLAAPDGYAIQHVDGHMQLDAHHSTPVHEAPSHTPHEPAVPAEDPSAALNRAQVGGTPIPPVHTAPPVSPEQTPAAPAEAPAPEHTPPEHAPEAPAHPALEPFVNEHGVPVNPILAKDYHLPDGRTVIWGGDFQKQIDVANRLIEEQRELGKHLTLLIEREKLNVFTGQMETRMYEYSTELRDVKVYPPDALPVKPFGAQDFVRP